MSHYNREDCVTCNVTLLTCHTIIENYVTCNVTLLTCEEEEEEEKLYFNNLLHVHQHTSMKYMIYDTVGY